jgi:hypothetical protein
MNVEAKIAVVKQEISAIEFLMGGIGDSNNPWINVYVKLNERKREAQLINLQTKENLLLQQQLPTQSQTGNGFSLIVSCMFDHLMAHTI